MSSREKDISKRMNDKTFTNSLRSKILKYSLSIKNENVSYHRRTFKNSYSSSWKLIVIIDFDILADLVEHSIRCIIFFRVSRRKMHFASTDKSDDVRFHEIAMTFSMICDSLSWQSKHKDYLKRLLFEWNESKYFAVKWSLSSHEMQIEWWIINLQKNTKWSRKLVRISARTKKL